MTERENGSYLKLTTAAITRVLLPGSITSHGKAPRAGSPYSLDLIDGATITPLIGADGRTGARPRRPTRPISRSCTACPPPIFLATNCAISRATDARIASMAWARASKWRWPSIPGDCEAIVRIALRRDAATLEYYRSGSTPDAFATLPKEWTIDQIRQFQDYFDALTAATRRAGGGSIVVLPARRENRTNRELFLDSLRR